MLLHHARRATRVGADGIAVPLAELEHAGNAALREALRRRAAGAAGEA